MMNFYTVPFHFSLVDLMGYGFALNVDKRIREYWLTFMKKYFTTRMEQNILKHVFVLVDTDFFIKRFKKHPDDNQILSPHDEEMLQFLDECYVPYSLILTKLDCINQNNYEEMESGTRIYSKNVNDTAQFEGVMNQLVPLFESKYMIRPFVNVTSSRLGFGITELQCTMASIAQLFDKSDVDVTDINFMEVANKL